MELARFGLAVAVAAALVAAAGCSQSMVYEPVTGTVTGIEKPGPFSLSGGDLKVETAGGRRSLKSLFNDATILVFTDSPCMPADTRLVRSEGYLDADVSIIEIASTGAACDVVRQCAADRGDFGRISSLCDPHGLARAYYGAGQDGAVVLVDIDGAVHSVGTLKDADYFLFRANRLAWEVERDREQRLYGDRGFGG
jgi:hypothetical protein